jgi:hypothetical protein
MNTRGVTHTHIENDDELRLMRNRVTRAEKLKTKLYDDIQSRLFNYLDTDELDYEAFAKVRNVYDAVCAVRSTMRNEITRYVHIKDNEQKNDE